MTAVNKRQKVLPSWGLFCFIEDRHQDKEGKDVVCKEKGKARKGASECEWRLGSQVSGCDLRFKRIILASVLRIAYKETRAEAKTPVRRQFPLSRSEMVIDRPGW